MATYAPQRVLQIENIEGFAKLRTDDFNTQELLIELLLQMRIMNLHLQSITGEELIPEDIITQEE